MAKHHVFGGSTAARTIACPAWIPLSANIPKPLDSTAAALGTASHAVLEKCLLDVDVDPITYAEREVEGVLIERDHIVDKIIPAINCFEDLMNTYMIDRYWVEVFSEVDHETGGTADFVGLSEDGETLVIGDYKSGDGVIVNAEKNKQALFYAWCLFNDNKQRFTEAFKHVKTIIIAIVQPSFRRDEFLDTWACNLDDIAAFEKDYKAAKALITDGVKTPCAGDHCQFCPAHAVCPAKQMLVDDMQGTPLTDIQKTDISRALKLADEIESWLKAVRKLAYERIEAGEEVEGFKLVNKRATRVWNEPEKTLRKIKLMKRLKTKEAVTEKLASPAQLEKLCKEHGIDYKKEFGSMASAVSSGLTLVKASDKRVSAINVDMQKRIAERFA